MDQLSNWLSFGGAFALGGALWPLLKDYLTARWKTRADKELELIRAEIAGQAASAAGGVEHKVWVSRIQFETEFQALQKVWAALAELRRALHATRPTFERVEAGSKDVDRFLARVNILTDKLNNLIAVADEAEPFIPADVYESAMAARLVARREISEITIAIDGFPRDQAWWASAEKHRTEVNDALKAVATSIRGRLSLLQIVP